MLVRRVALVTVLLSGGAFACSDADDEATKPVARPPTAKSSVQARVSGTGTSGLRVRAKPTTMSTQLGTLKEGELVTITCQVQGENINGNDVWNRLDEEGGYVSDAYVDGPRGFEKGAPRCDATMPPPPMVDGGGTGGTVDIEGPAVQPHVQFFADEACKLVAACRASTYVGHSPQADLALDFPIGEDYGQSPDPTEVAFGDRLAEFGVANKAKYWIDYVIYRQRINSGTGWRMMEDRGSITQNHYDHVHVSFDP